MAAYNIAMGIMDTPELSENETVMLQNWIAAFEKAGGSVIQEIPKKKQIFALLKKGHSVFDPPRSKRSQETDLPLATSSIYLVSLFGDAKLPTHHHSSITFALELRPPNEWVPNIQGIPGEFVLFDAEFRWTIVVTHEETEILLA